MKEKIQKINDFEWLLPKSARKEMKVDAKIIANQKILNSIEKDAIHQLSNVACLPGIIEPVVGMSDMHFGYGLPMGAVMAFDPEKGIISSGCTGFDINCGVNSIRTNLTYDEVKSKLKELIPTLFNAIPCGVGAKGKLRLTNEQLDQVMINGVNWAIENGYGIKKDAEHTEENGCMKGADPSTVSDMAKKRGLPQLGTLGAGNHFLEIQKVSEIYDKEFAKKLGIADSDQVLIMLHCGSRGFGHQVASDYLKIHEQAVKKYNIWLPDNQLVGAPANSKEGQDYYSAMKCAVNYAFTNRLVMTQWIREVFEKIFSKDWESMDMHTIYAIAHNITKKEEHKIDGKKKEIYVTRKGATRAFPDIPALIAGTMGTASYICKGTETAMEKTFGSTVHGAGRIMSRHGAINKFRGDKIKQELADRGIVAQSTHPKVLAEEAPLAYKNVMDVVDSVHGAGVSLKVCKMTPMGVCKG
ncbi:MAG: RtcB family protein [Nanoarchaeota archaeon]|nr:RtcB family protein [Nanoarchaeota archaeon]MBU1135059.1 RtcB family protein [Nanoarchaeota archaeon]MBU2519969.1 RtcB family protein [Nanoarchaeota archaeon]